MLKNFNKGFDFYFSERVETNSSKIEITFSDSVSINLTLYS